MIAFTSLTSSSTNRGFLMSRHPTSLLILSLVTALYTPPASASPNGSYLGVCYVDNDPYPCVIGTGMAQGVLQLTLNNIPKGPIHLEDGIGGEGKDAAKTDGYVEDKPADMWAIFDGTSEVIAKGNKARDKLLPKAAKLAKDQNMNILTCIKAKGQETTYCYRFIEK
jgi:hypothetical protein